MRLWSIHPRFLDGQGLVALWREALLAQKVLLGKTKGYRSHPQLIRFREARDPLAMIGNYLHAVALEAKTRDYRFDRTKISKCRPQSAQKLKVTQGQLEYESKHLLGKLFKRNLPLFEKWKSKNRFSAHPCFVVVAGGVEAWEKI